MSDDRPRADRPRHDPYDIAFGDGIDDTLFPPIAEEAEARDQPLHDPDRFLFLASVGRLVEAIADAGDPDAGERLRQHGRLIYHAFHHWRAGRVVAELDDTALRDALDGLPPDDDATPLAAPAPAGYFRLPRNRVWAVADPALRPEPADGFFWTLLGPGDDSPPALHLLLALGVRPDRPGFSVVPASGALDSPAGWAAIDARPGGDDFASTIPGGELDRLYSVETPLEALKLASRCFRAVAAGRG